MTDIPWIVSLDDHVVEPPDVWTTRLPAKYRDVGPHVVMAPAGTPILDGGGYREAPGTDGPDVAWWFYEDQQYSVKRLIAAAGYPADEIGFDGITFDQMRPGCWQPQARLDDMTMNHVEASLAFPNYPRFCGQIFLQGARTRSWRSLCVEAYNDWQVEEWCAGSERPPDPAVPGPAVGRRARRRRGAAQRRARRAGGRVLRAAGVARAPEHPLRLLGSVLRRVRARRAPWWPCTSAPAPRRSRRREDAPDAVQAVNIFANSALSLDRLPLLRRARALPRAQAAVRRGADRLDPLRARAGRRRVGDPPRLERQPGRNVSEPPSQLLLPPGRQLLLQGRRRACENLDRVGRDNIAFETDYPHQDSTWPNTHQVAKELFGQLDADDGATRSCAATPSGSSGSRDSATAAVRVP